MNPSKNPERIPPGVGAIGAHVVGRKHPNVGMLIELRLQLLLDGPVEVFVQDVGPPDVARRILHDRKAVEHGCGDEDDRLAARPEQTQMHEQRRSDSVRAVGVAGPLHHVEELVGELQAFGDGGGRSQVENAAWVVARLGQGEVRQVDRRRDDALDGPECAEEAFRVEHRVQRTGRRHVAGELAFLANRDVNCVHQQVA